MQKRTPAHPSGGLQLAADHADQYQRGRRCPRWHDGRPEPATYSPAHPSSRPPRAAVLGAARACPALTVRDRVVLRRGPAERFAHQADVKRAYACFHAERCPYVRTTG